MAWSFPPYKLIVVPICNGMDLVPKEVDVVVVLQKLQAVRFVHSLFVITCSCNCLREHIEGGLTANQVLEVHVWKTLSQIVNHRSTDVVLLHMRRMQLANHIILLKGRLLFRSGIVSHRADVNHGRPEVDKLASVVRESNRPNRLMGRSNSLT